MLEKLFSSTTRVTLLTYLLSNPEMRFYLRQLERETGLAASTLKDELHRLEEIGLLRASQVGNIRFYQVDREFVLYPELKSMILKTQGVAKVIKENLATLGEIKYAFIYGSFAKGEEKLGSDIDVMIIGHVDLVRLNSLLSSVEDKLRRTINYIVFSPQDWEERKAEGEEFIRDLLADPKIMLVGDGHEL